MGQEIVYCFKCQIRLTGGDLEKGDAIRCGNRIACKACGADLLASLSPEERRELEGRGGKLPSSTKIETARALRPASTTRIQRAREEGASKPKPSPGVWIAAGVGALVVIGIAVAALSGGPPPAPPPPVSKPPPPRPVEDPRPGEARAAIDRAKQAVKERPEDVDGHVAAATEALKKSDSTLHYREAMELFDAVTARQKVAYAEEIGKLGKDAKALEAARKRHATAEWSAQIDAALGELKRRDAGDALLGHWTLDRAEGAVLGGVAWVPGKIGGAAKIVHAGEITISPFAFSSPAMTLAAWVWHDVLDTHVQRYVSIRNEVAVLRHENKLRRLHFYIKTGDQLRQLTVDNALEKGRWHFVAGTWDGVTQRVYLDGVERGSATPGGTLAAGGDLYISAVGESLVGMIDDVRVYGRALSGGELRTLYEKGAGTKPWRPLFDGKTLGVLNPQSHASWRVEDGALLLSGSGAAQSAEEFGDGEFRFRFEGSGIDNLYFKVRQGAGGGVAVTFNTNSFAALGPGPHELVFTCQGDSVTATLDGRAVAATIEGKGRTGRLQWNANGKRLRVLSVDVR